MVSVSNSSFSRKPLSEEDEKDDQHGSSTKPPKGVVCEGLICHGQKTYISRLILQMETCLHNLDAENVTMPRLETMAVLVHDSMSASSRNYHSVQHVFDISRDLRDSIAILAAIFHDCIYYHVDGQLTDIQAGILEGVFQTDPLGGHSQMIAHRESATNFEETEKNSDPLLLMVEMIFGLTHGQKVTQQNGLNEFLSAVIAVRELREHLPMSILAQIACCIEATIPFRQPINGIPPMERLYRNMKKTRNVFEFELTDQQLVESVQRACILSNEDVGNFGSKDRHWFLDNTWSLLPETNESLRQQYLYTAKEFHHGVFKMNGFFGFLKPELVFISFQGVPSEEVMSQKLETCSENLEIGKKYVGAKLLAVSVLTAFAELTGGDAPMSLFMGDLPSRHHVSTKFEDSLPSPPAAALEKCDSVVYEILSQGRRTETSFDIRQSPLAAYLYGCLGDEALIQVLKSNTMYPIEKENSLELLACLPREAIENVAKNMAMVALSRSDLIRDVVKNLPDDRAMPPPGAPAE
jgi:hypothetical protein